jgi:hypothetical protein
MHRETAPKDGKSVLLNEEDATGNSDAAPGKDHLRRRHASSFFLSRAAAQPATASDVIASRSVALVPVTAAVGAQTTLDEAKRASQARWRFAASLIAATSLVVAGTGIYYRGEVAYEAMIRKAAETKTAELAQERDHAAALANELATVHRDFDTTAALSSKAADEVAELRNAAETKTAEPAQERDHAAALANRAPAAAAPVAAPARKLDPDEVATLMDRAKRLIAAGDISPARLLLERAADAQESTAALMLALTYDPDVLETQNSRNIIPDPTMARVWYHRAAQLGSADAQRRLSQLQN